MSSPTPDFVTLPMYDWPEAHAETDQEWTQLRALLLAQNIASPTHIIRSNADLPWTRGPKDQNASSTYLDLPIIWKHPSLLLGQTCWGPLEKGLAAHVEVVGQPDYSGFEGGEGEMYSSAILVRRADYQQNINTSYTQAVPSDLRGILPLLEGKRLAFNSQDSMSGFLALERDLLAIDQRALDVFSSRLETGGHRASIRAVAGDEADVCAVDCRTWDLAKRFEVEAGKLEVVGWTARRKGLPYITSKARDVQERESIQKALAGMSSS